MSDTSNTILSVVKQTGKHSTLLKLLDLAGLSETLQQAGPFTLFAPTDEAFGEIEEETMNALKEESNKEALVAILKYHVLDNELVISEITEAIEITTLAGNELMVEPLEDMYLIGETATTGKEGAKASNGVIYSVDSVIIPDEMSEDEEMVEEEEEV